MKNPKSISAISLSQLIESLTKDLTESATQRPSGWRPTFRVAEAVLEASVTFERNIKAGGKFTILVAEFAPEAAERSSSAHKISLKLVPVGEGMSVEVAKIDPLIRGTGAGRRKDKSKD